MKNDKKWYADLNNEEIINPIPYGDNWTKYEGCADLCKPSQLFDTEEEAIALMIQYFEYRKNEAEIEVLRLQSKIDYWLDFEKQKGSQA